MKKLILRALVVAAFLSCLSASAAAYDWGLYGANVTLVEATYMPQRITFQVSGNASSTCTAQTWLTWNPQGPDESSQQANANAVYALLIAAQVSGTPVSVFGNNANCTVLYIHFGNG